MRSLDTIVRLARSKNQPVPVKYTKQSQPTFLEMITAFVALAVLGGFIWLCLLGLLVDSELLIGVIVTGGVFLLVLLGIVYFIAAGPGGER